MNWEQIEGMDPARYQLWLIDEGIACRFNDPAHDMEFCPSCQGGTKLSNDLITYREGGFRLCYEGLVHGKMNSMLTYYGGNVRRRGLNRDQRRIEYLRGRF